jgi:DNA invertase Pin-like site-specific DNA recombinase
MRPESTPVGKVTAEHLRRGAYLYIRQSSLKQVVNNTESTWRQYDLKGRALALGWRPEQITVIDTDQGRSGASAVGRDGFALLTSEVALGKAGIVLGLEVSRLARNNTDWHRLLEICALAGTLILDEDGVYDPRTFNDRLVLGLKGTVSEAELHLLAARLRGGQLSKARRGELRQILPIGYVYDGADHVVIDPDASVRGPVARVFQVFAATGSARQVVIAFNRDQLLFPARIRTGARKGEIVFTRLTHSRVLTLLHNPCYAGAFAYGKRRGRISPEGKQYFDLLPREEWDTLIEEHHPGYITFAQWEANQALLTANARARTGEMVGAPPREGAALLQGLAVCGVCGRGMTVGYHQQSGREVPDYRCMKKAIEEGGRVCQRIPGAALDDAVAALLLEKLTPLAIEAALAVADEITARAEEADRLRKTHLEAAEYRADLARRRYTAVDPDNRLVADALEADWNTALREARAAREEYEQARIIHAPIDQAERDRLAALAGDLHSLWHDPQTPARERKRIARLLIRDVTLAKTDQVTAHIRLSGGQHHTLRLPLPLGGGKLWQTPKSIVSSIDELLDRHTDAQIAEILNRQGLTSGKGLPFHRLLVRDIRENYHLRTRYQRLRERGLLTAAEIADRLDISHTTLKAWYHAGLVTGEQYNDKGARLYHPPGPNPPRIQQGIRYDQRPKPQAETATTSDGK